MQVKPLFSVLAATFILSSISSVGFDSAVAATISFSYEFLSGESIFGTVDGDLQSNQNTVKNLSNLSATYSGEPGTQLQFQSTDQAFITLTGRAAPGQDSFVFFGFANSTETASLQPNFGFSLGGASTTTNGATVGTFMTSSNMVAFPFGTNQKEAEVFTSSRWIAFVVPASVPEPSVLPGFFGLAAALGTVCIAKRHCHRSGATRLDSSRQLGG